MGEPQTPVAGSSGRRGKALRSQARAIIFRVFSYFQEKKDGLQGDEKRSLNVRDEVAKATGVSESHRSNDNQYCFFNVRQFFGRFLV